jgi:lipopolysaccharide transport system permease protein
LARQLSPWFIVSNLWRHRELVWQFTLRSVEMRHKGSHLGLVWAVLRPLMMLALYLFVFGYIFGARFGMPGETSVDYGLGMFMGLSIFQLVAEVISISPLTIVTQPNFVKKVVFPLEVLPVSAVGASIFHFLITIALVILGVVVAGPGLTWSVLWVPVIVFPVILLALGLGWLISALGTFLRDIGQVTEFLSVVLMYASAIFYSPQRISGRVWTILRLNPVLHAVDLCRHALLWHLPLNGVHLAFLYACGLATFLVGHAVFARLKPAFADVL